MRLGSVKQKTRKVLASLLLALSMTMCITPSCQAFFFELIGMDKLTNPLANISSKVGSLPGISTAVGVVQNFCNTYTSLFHDWVTMFNSLGTPSGGDKDNSARQSVPGKKDTKDKMAAATTTEITGYGSGNSDTLQNQINSYNQKNSIETPDVDPVKGNKIKITPTSAAALSAKPGSDELNEVKRDFVLNATGANSGIPDVPHSKNPQLGDLQVKADHDTIAANQSVAIQGFSSDQSGQVAQKSSQNGSGNEGDSSADDNLSKVALGIFGDQDFWNNITGFGGIGQLFRSVQGYILGLGALGFEILTISKLGIRLLSASVSMLTFVADKAIGKPGIMSNLVQKSPQGMLIKKMGM